MKLSNSGKLFAAGVGAYLLGSVLERAAQALSRNRPQGNMQHGQPTVPVQELPEEHERRVRVIAEHYGISREEAIGIYLDELRNSLTGQGGG